MFTVISRFSVYIAAVVLFFSWLISNSFVMTADEDTQTMDAVQSEQTQAQQFADLSNGQRALLKQVADIEDRLDKLPNEHKSTDVQERDAQDESDGKERWVKSFESDSTQLAENAEELGELGRRVEPPGDLE